MTAHVCQDCGMMHDAPVSTESPEVQIARIQAESAYKIAQLQARGDKYIAEVEAEAAVEVAESQAEAIVEALSVEDAPTEDEPVEGDSEPVLINAPIIDSGDTVDETAPPKADETEHQAEETKPKKSVGLGLW